MKYYRGRKEKKRGRVGERGRLISACQEEIHIPFMHKKLYFGHKSYFTLKSKRLSKWVTQLLTANRKVIGIMVLLTSSNLILQLLS